MALMAKDQGATKDGAITYTGVGMFMWQNETEDEALLKNAAAVCDWREDGKKMPAGFRSNLVAHMTSDEQLITETMTKLETSLNTADKKGKKGTHHHAYYKMSNGGVEWAPSMKATKVTRGVVRVWRAGPKQTNNKQQTTKLCYLCLFACLKVEHQSVFV